MDEDLPTPVELLVMYAMLALTVAFWVAAALGFVAALRWLLG